MKSNIKKIPIILLYIAAVVALVFIFTGFLGEKKHIKKSENEIANTIYSFYEFTDSGDFEKLQSITLEGEWYTELKQDNEKEVNLTGVVEKMDFIEKAVKEFGEDGWKTHIISLEILDQTEISYSEFYINFPREYEILKYLNDGEELFTIYVAELKGFRAGACSLIDWSKKIPVIWHDSKWKVVLTGTPKYMEAIHGSHWFTNLEF